MLYSLMAVLGCGAVGTLFQPDAPAAACDYDAPVETPLAWDERGAGGVSADDMLHWALGAFSAGLTWDDGTTTDLRLEVRPVDARETTYGPTDTCMFLLAGNVDWTVETTDGRLGLAGSSPWEMEDPEVRTDLGGVGIDAMLDPASLPFERGDPTSTTTLRLFLDQDAADLTGAQIQEQWAVDGDTVRLCVRASTEPASVECRDFDDTGATAE